MRKGGIYQKSNDAVFVSFFMNNFAKIKVFNLKLIFKPTKAIGSYWGELSKNRGMMFCPPRDCMSMQNLESVALIYIHTFYLN